MLDIILKKLIHIRVALADTHITNPPGDFYLPNPIGSTSIKDLLERIGDYLYAIAFPIAIIMIIWGAFLLLTSGGNEEKVTTAKKAILYAVIGIAIVLVAEGLITVVGSILGAK